VTPRLPTILAIGLALTLGGAEVTFILARPVLETRYERSQADPLGRFNLATPRLGVTVRASSVSAGQRSHPAYVVGEHIGTSIEQWASAPSDPRPWIEVEFDRPRLVDGVDLIVAEGPDPGAPPMRDAAIECFASDNRAVGNAILVHIEAARAHIGVACEQTVRVRVTFLPRRQGARPVARLQGLLIWGSS
jgi:hypothetical protein